jgi:HEAT repeat protein
MTRLGHLLTILATALAPAVAGSAFAQSPDVHVQVPRVDVPRVDIPRIVIPRIDLPEINVQIPQIDIPRVDIPLIDIPQVEIPDAPHFEMPFDFDLKLDLQIDKARELARLADLGRLGQTFAFSQDQREQIEAAKDRAHEAMDRARDAVREGGMRYAQQGPQPKAVRVWERCNERDADRLYDCGRDALDDKQWDRAVDYFGRVAAAKSERGDAALYWKAYAQNKLGQRAEALNTITQFKSSYPKSRWGNDVSALEIDVRQHSGQPVKPGETSDDDLKLLALQALMNNNSPEAVPMLEKILQGPQSPRVKDRALFVLAQTQTPAARAIVVKVAKGGANPDLQGRAIRYLGEMNTPESRQALSEVYTGSADKDMKRNILRSYMVARDRDHLLAAARGEQDAELRLEAIRQLGNMRADDALGELYAKETSAEVKKQIIRSLGNTQNADKLLMLAQSEPDAELRRTAIRTLGQMRRQDTGARLVAMYEKEQNPDVRKSVIDALFIQNNATALVDLARKEKDGDMKVELVKRLSNMHEKEAQDYLIELLK